ncbi:BEL1-like homeodomain protein 9 [Gastrolobium bilobum]|uniref:BEL1-like homeodomain protein 9 n=1 Tax=Gastrolobium bilobum TaxID=150636 RepID=UPI002AAF6A73|nr:BEL1-like homeodomain protein 9 [Gastrolobium bilobum]
MAEGFEGYHVPQQSRRDKLRVVVAQNQHGLVETSSTLPLSCATLLPLYDPSLISSDLLTCANQHGHSFLNNQASKQNLGSCVVKEEGSNLMMGFGGVMNGSSSSSSSNVSSVSHHGYLDPESSLPLNPSTIQVISSSNNNNNNNNNPFFYHTQSLQNFREFDQSYNGSEIMVFKPEPLSLSLSSHNSASQQGNLPLELNLQRYGSVIYGDKVSGGGGGVIPGLVGGVSASASNEVSRCSVPLGPFTCYASILKGSRFLKPAQQLLEELCDVGGRGICVEKMVVDASLMEPPPESLSEDPLGDEGEGIKKSRLLTMLDEVYRRYRQYYQQMLAVVTSFEYVSDLSNAAPYASLALKAMSKHFRCLKNAITDQLQFTNKAHFHISNRKDESPRFGNSDRGPYNQRSGFFEHQPVWRPQRGLPERAVTVLRAWLFEHFLHPYPTDTDKLMLAKQTGLSRSQVSNWFINARVRLWKPMVEEIHMLETRQVQKNSQKEEHCRNKLSDHLPSDSSLVSENPSTSTDKFQDTPFKRAINELPNIHVRSQEQLNLPCTGNQPVGVGVSMGGASSSVSLTLGLYQNHGIGLAEPFPLSAAQRFGLALENNNEGYVMSGFESQNRHFGRDVIGGQLLHDFVG